MTSPIDAPRAGGSPPPSSDAATDAARRPVALAAAEITTATPARAAAHTPPPLITSRRHLLRSLGGLVGSAGGIGAIASAIAPKHAIAAAPVDVYADVEPASLINRLLARTSFGITTADLNLANTLGYSAYLERQLAHTAITENPTLNSLLSSSFTLTCPAFQLYDTTLVANNAIIFNELIDATIARGAYSNRQLFERMVEFWGDHFNVDIYSPEAYYLKTLHDRVIRQYALTSFPQLFNAVARSPAMVAYLNNDISSDDQLNENYSREMLELHTIGAEHLYSYPAASVQATIVSVARCMTGWGRYGGAFDDISPGGTRTQLRGLNYFNATGVKNRVIYNSTPLTGVIAGAHDTGAKVLGTVFGSAVIPAGRLGNNGRQDAQDVFDMLMAHPATATNISRKLCEHFLGEGTPTGVINAVRDAYLNTSNPQGLGDIKAMLRVIFSPNILASAPALYKRPFHAYVGALRVLPSTITSRSTLRNQFIRAGHLPFAWSAPDGYPKSASYWATQVLPRWCFFSSLVTKSNGDAGGDTGAIVDDAAFFGDLELLNDVITRIDQGALTGMLSAADRARILDILGTTPTSLQRRDALGLALCSPSNQWY
jgi:uncharacterized protein (DUF1800 family)